MSPRKARAAGLGIDAAAGGVLLALSALPALHYISGVASAVAGLATLSVPILPAVATVVVGAVLGTMAVACTAWGLGFLADAASKIHIPGPKKAVVGVGHAFGHVGHEVARPFKWAGHKLRHPFNRAHDGSTGAGHSGPSGNRPRLGRHSL